MLKRKVQGISYTLKICGSAWFNKHFDHKLGQINTDDFEEKSNNLPND